MEESNRIMDKGRVDELVARRIESILYDFLSCTIINGNNTNRKKEKKRITRTTQRPMGSCRFCTFEQNKVGALLSLDRRKLANKCCFVVIRNYYDMMFNKYTACLLTKLMGFFLGWGGDWNF